MSEIIYNKMEIAASLIEIEGHPLNTFTKINEAIKLQISSLKKEINNLSQLQIIESLENIRQLAIYYAEKGDILYPQLKVKYDIAGPADLMWESDDKIRDELAYLVRKDSLKRRNWYDRVISVVNEIENMTFKDERVLFPGCAVNFTEEEWIGIYHDMKEYPSIFNIQAGEWEKAESIQYQSYNLMEGEVNFATGSMSVNELTFLLNTMPFEITFVDSNDLNKYFNEGEKVFKRPLMALNRPVYSCHPPVIEEKVRRIINEFKNGTLDSLPMWMEKNGHVWNVCYYAVRDKDGNYLGTMELCQDMNFAREYFEKKEYQITEEN